MQMFAAMFTVFGFSKHATIQHTKTRIYSRFHIVNEARKSCTRECCAHFNTYRKRNGGLLTSPRDTTSKISSLRR